MSVRRMKVWMMWATCLGLIGIVAGDAHAFGGLFKKKDNCADPCATAAADPCASSCDSGRGGLRDWFGNRKAKWGSRGASDCGPAAFASGPCGPVMGAPVATAPVTMPAPVATAPVTQRVKVQEWVPTVVEETVTVMRPVTRTETYTAQRWECVPETVTVQVTVNRMVTSTVTENRVVTERIPVQKTVTAMERIPVQKTVTVMERRPVQKTVTVNETVWRNVMVTEMQTKTVTHKVSVPYCETKGPTFSDRVKKITDPCYTPCPRTVSGCRTEKVCETVSCPVTKCTKVAECVPVTKTVCSYECVPVQKTVTAYECVPVQKTVTAYECVTKTVAVPVTRTQCVPTVEARTQTVQVRKQVAYQATRQVTECVPVQEKVKVTKMVCQTVERDVVVAPHAAAAPCATGFGNPCATAAPARAGLFDRFKSGMGGLCDKFKGRKKSGCCEAAASGAAAGCCN
jgi:hypothetical protein